MRVALGRDRLIGVHDHDVLDRNDFVAWQIGASGVLTHGICVDGLVNAHGAELAVGFGEDVGADPAHLGGHFLLADVRTAGGSFFEFLSGFPTAAAEDNIGFHGG